MHLSLQILRWPDLDEDLPSLRLSDGLGMRHFRETGRYLVCSGIAFDLTDCALAEPNDPARSSVRNSSSRAAGSPLRSLSPRPANAVPTPRTSPDQPRCAQFAQTQASPGVLAALFWVTGHDRHPDTPERPYPCTAAQRAHSKVKAVNSRMTGCLSAPTNRVIPLHFLQIGPSIRSPVMTSTVNIGSNYTLLLEASQQ